MDLKEAINKNYEKFFAKFPEIDTLPVASWSKTHVLAYFCKRYKDHYSLDFTFSFKAAPSKSREMFEISKMTQQLSSQPDILKSYIDWIFNEKIIERKKRVTSLGYLTHPELVNEYKFKYLFSKKIDRTTPLPQKFIDICKAFGHEISSYGDIAFLTQIPDQDALLRSLGDANFNFQILESMK